MQTVNIPIATAYGYAVACGYTGTEEEFATLMLAYQMWQDPSSGTGITNAIKTAFLQLAQKTAYVDNSGPQVYTNLNNALNGGIGPGLLDAMVLDMATLG